VPRNATPHRRIVNIHIELQKRGITPFELTQEEFDLYYANIYNVLGSSDTPEHLRLIINDVIAMYQLRQAGYFYGQENE
jgi:hypothetical protein